MMGYYRIFRDVITLVSTPWNKFRLKINGASYGPHFHSCGSIAYSPLNGAGLEPVTRVLKESGYENITVVEEQKNPDGNLPTIKQEVSVYLKSSMNFSPHMATA